MHWKRITIRKAACVRFDAIALVSGANSVNEGSAHLHSSSVPFSGGPRS